jgi:hypothetical protein
MNALTGTLIVFAVMAAASKPGLAEGLGAASPETKCATPCAAQSNPTAFAPLDVAARKARFNQLKPGIPEDYLVAHQWCVDASWYIPGAIFRIRHMSSGIFSSELRYPDGALKVRNVGQWSIRADQKALSHHFGNSTLTYQYRLDPDNGSLGACPGNASSLSTRRDPG